MWIFTRNGFASAVEDRDDRKGLMVRFRDPTDAANYAKAVKIANRDLKRTPRITRTDRADYLWRIRCSKRHWARMLAREAKATDYDNFKSMMHDRAPHWGGYELMRIWQATMDHQRERDGQRRAKAQRLPIHRHHLDTAPGREWSHDDEIVYTAGEAQRFTGHAEEGPF